jgi:hypothetical protein
MGGQASEDGTEGIVTTMQITDRWVCIDRRRRTYGRKALAAPAQPQTKNNNRSVHTPRTLPMINESRRRRELIMPMTELRPGTCAAGRESSEEERERREK